MGNTLWTIIIYNIMYACIDIYSFKILLHQTFGGIVNLMGYRKQYGSSKKSAPTLQNCVSTKFPQRNNGEKFPGNSWRRRIGMSVVKWHWRCVFQRNPFLVQQWFMQHLEGRALFSPCFPSPCFTLITCFSFLLHYTHRKIQRRASAVRVQGKDGP